MSTPESYVDESLAAQPFGLYSWAIQLDTLITDVANQLNTIYTTIGALQFSWTGGSASEAQDFSNRLSAATASLFGTEKNPQQGAFNLLMAGMAGASQNYNAAEEWVVSAFNALIAALDGQAQPAQPQATQPSVPGPSVEVTTPTS